MKWTVISCIAAGAVFLGQSTLEAAVLSDDFNSDTSANYSIVSSSADTAVTFAFDYSTLGIPPAPGTTDASTLGLKLEANVASPSSSEAVTLHTNEVLTGDYIVRFDAWMNAVGPFPAGGGGSTEFLTAGVGGDGTTVNRGGATGVGGWTAVTGEGGSSRDYRLYKGSGEQFAESGQFTAGASSAGGGAHNGSDPHYAAFGGIDVANLPVQGANNGGPASQTGTTSVGSFGFEWHTVQLVVDSDGGLGGAPSVEWSIDGLSIGKLDAGAGTSFSTDGRIALGYMDIFSSVADSASLSFGLIDNLQVVPEPSTGVCGLIGLLLVPRRRRQAG